MGLNDAQLLERLVRQLESGGGNIAETYHDWLICAFVCASYDSIGGREYFHRISRLSAKYKPADCDKQYNACLKAGAKGDATLAPLLALSAQNGFLLKDTFTPRQAQAGGGYQVRPAPPAVTPPPTPKFKVNAFPFLQEIEKLIGNPEVLPSAYLAFLTGLSSLAPDLYINYQGQLQHCTLYFCCVAPPASGKSELGKIGHMFDQVQDFLMKKSSDLWAEYKEQRKQAKASDRDEIPVPPLFTLFLPADTSTAALMKTLKDNDGNGLMWESELDTLTRNMKTEFGNFNDILRNNWGGETIKSNRKKDREFITIRDPHFSLFCSGTPQQIPHFFGSAENGLFSRFLFSSLPLSLQWKSQFDVTPSKRQVEDMGVRVGCLYHWRGACVVTFTDKQKKEHERVWDNLCKETYQISGDEIIPCVRRHALSHLRMSALLTLFQIFVNRRATPECRDAPPPSVVCSSDAWTLALELAKYSLSATLNTHALLISPKPTNASKKEEEREKLYSGLPALFTLANLPNTLSQSTKYRLLEMWRNAGRIEKDGDKWRKRE